MTVREGMNQHHQPSLRNLRRLASLAKLVEFEKISVISRAIWRNHYIDLTCFRNLSESLSHYLLNSSFQTQSQPNLNRSFIVKEKIELLMSLLLKKLCIYFHLSYCSAFAWHSRGLLMHMVRSNQSNQNTCRVVANFGPIGMNCGISPSVITVFWEVSLAL